MSEFAVEKARTEDAAGMRSCARAAYAHYIERMGKEPGPMLDDYADRIANDHAFLVRNGDEVGALLVLIEEPYGILLDNVAVTPGLQGTGIGSRLMRFAEREARNLGYREIFLYTHIVMVESYELYLRLGYEETERKTVNGYQRIYMKKSLED